MDRAQLTAEMADGARPEFLFFWGHTRTPGHEVGKWVLSQWWPVEFTVDGQTYRSAEHFMMAEKARLFGDEPMRTRVLAADTPADAKRLGRAISGFDQDTWEAHRFDIVLRGSIAKFGQHDVLRDFLLATADKILVEAAPPRHHLGHRPRRRKPRRRRPFPMARRKPPRLRPHGSPPRPLSRPPLLARSDS
ncbi:NADAR family protein [Nocardia concava]|uniref:NADAR family protein n=1 Tax=Nocardia concava TaxID=257281 RepID=UPI00402BF1D1